MANIIIIDLGGLDTKAEIEAALNAALTANPTYKFVCFGADWMPGKYAVLQEV